MYVDHVGFSEFEEGIDMSLDSRKKTLLKSLKKNLDVIAEGP